MKCIIQWLLIRLQKAQTSSREVSTGLSYTPHKSRRLPQSGIVVDLTERLLSMTERGSIEDSGGGSFQFPPYLVDGNSIKVRNRGNETIFID